MSLLSFCISNINRAAKQSQTRCRVPNSKLIQKVLRTLVIEGYLSSFSVVNRAHIQVFIKYIAGRACIRAIRQISKPTLRVFMSKKVLNKMPRQNNLNNAFQTIILTTPLGILTAQQAVGKNVGGEALLLII